MICLGLSALDQVWRVDRPFAGGSEKIKAVAYGTLGGGMAANASRRGGEARRVRRVLGAGRE